MNLTLFKDSMIYDNVFGYFLGPKLSVKSIGVIKSVSNFNAASLAVCVSVLYLFTIYSEPIASHNNPKEAYFIPFGLIRASC